MEKSLLYIFLVLRCGFRSMCVQDPKPRCVCRDGFEGDPSLRCYPKEVDTSCSCREVLLSSSGPSRLVTIDDFVQVLKI